MLVGDVVDALQHLVDERLRRRPVERIEEDPLGEGILVEPRSVEVGARAGDPDDEQLIRHEFLGDGPHDGERFAVGPVEVLEEDHGGHVARDAAQPADERRLAERGEVFGAGGLAPRGAEPQPRGHRVDVAAA